MDNLTITGTNNSVNFTGLYAQKNLLTKPVRKSIADAITSKLNQPNPVNKKGKSYINHAQDYGYDIFMSQGKNQDSVRVDIISSAVMERANKSGGVPIADKTCVGVYSSPEQFKSEDFSNKFKVFEKEVKHQNMMAFGYIGSFIAAIGLAVGTAFLDGTSKPVSEPAKPQTTILAKDTLKSDSLKPLFEDTLKLTKKIKK